MVITKFVLKRPVTTVLAILCLIVFGYQSITGASLELTPDMDTTLTTIISMIPMALALGNSGEMTRGLAIVNIGGLTASTVLSLLMLPVFYSIMSRTPKEERKKYESGNR